MRPPSIRGQWEELLVITSQRNIAEAGALCAQMMIPLLQELVLGLRQHGVSRWSCCCLPRLGSCGLCWDKEQIFAHTSITLSTVRVSWDLWAWPQAIAPEWGCAWWAVLISAVTWMHFRKCWNVIQGVEYRQKCCFPLLPNAGEKSGCVFNLPPFPHDWTYKWGGLVLVLGSLMREEWCVGFQWF